MSTNVVHAPRTLGLGARRLIYIAIGLIAVALVTAVLFASAGDSDSSGPAVRSDGGPEETAVSQSVLAGRAGVAAHPSDEGDVSAGSGVSIGRAPYTTPEPNLLPK
jgi:hypothetical protein